MSCFCSCEDAFGSGSSGGSGGGETLAQTLVFGNISGGTDIVMSTGDEIQGQTDLQLRGGDDNDVLINGGDGTVLDGGFIRLLGGGAVNNGDGGQILGNGGPGDGTGSGARIFFQGGLGGPTNGQGGVARWQGGDGSGNGDGGIGECLGGNSPGNGTGGVALLQGGSSNIAGGEARVIAGAVSVNGAGATAIVRGGAAASTGPANAGGNVSLEPTVGAGGGADGRAFVGAQTILTNVANLGGFAQLFIAKAGGTINGDTANFRTLQSSDASITVTQNANDINLSALVNRFSIEVAGTGSTTGTAYVTINTTAALPIISGQTWNFNLSCFAVQPASLTTVNTKIRWQIEIAAGIFSTISEWEVNPHYTSTIATGAWPMCRNETVGIIFTNARIRLQMAMSAVVGTGGTVGDLSILGVRTV